MRDDVMMSRLREYGESVINTLKPSDPRVTGAVQLTFTDRSQATINQSFAEMAGDWLYVFSLTDGYFLYRRSDLAKWTSQSASASTGLSHEPVAKGARQRAA